MNRRILALAIPNIISNITVPLLGLVDLAIVGRLGSETMVGGIAIGTTIFNFMYWNFSFLRMGTSGMAAQAYGARNLPEATRVLVRALGVALGAALLIWVAQGAIRELALYVMEGSPEGEAAAAEYFAVRVWAAPATLSLYAFTGWFIGMQNSRTPMWISIVSNLMHVALSLVAAVGLGLGIVGVALGTVIAQWFGVAMALFVLVKYYGRLFSWELIRHSGLSSWRGMRQFFRVNVDIFLRTLCLVTVLSYFTVASSSQGDVLLAVNALMMQLFLLYSYMMDGFAYAGEALAGRYYGARNEPMLHRAVRWLLFWGGMVMLLYTGVYAALGEQIMGLLTSSPNILSAAHEYTVWIVLVPVCSALAFILDGIMVGISATYIMRNTMFLAVTVFFGCYFLIEPAWGNKALWLSFLIYLGIRGVVQLIAARRRLLG